MVRGVGDRGIRGVAGVDEGVDGKDGEIEKAPWEPLRRGFLMIGSPGGGVDRLGFPNFSVGWRKSCPDSRLFTGIFFTISLRRRSRSRLTSTSIRHSMALFTSSNA